MEVILIEKSRLGEVGAIVDVKPGYFRNFLEPQNKALRATAENKQFFDEKKALIEQEVAEKTQHATEVAEKIKDLGVELARQAGEDGRLYGSVTPADIIKLVNNKAGVELHKSAIELIHPIKYIGSYDVQVKLFAEITAHVKLSVVRTA